MRRRTDECRKARPVLDWTVLHLARLRLGRCVLLPTFSCKVEFTFRITDVNYGGSTGFGRAYRKRLDKNWGVVDVEDTIAAVKHLVREGKVDQKRVAITGGSAGASLAAR